MLIVAILHVLILANIVNVVGGIGVTLDGAKVLGPISSISNVGNPGATRVIGRGGGADNTTPRGVRRRVGIEGRQFSLPFCGCDVVRYWGGARNSWRSGCSLDRISF